MKTKILSGFFLLLVFSLLANCQNATDTNHIIVNGNDDDSENEVQKLNCRGNTAVCVGPFSYQICTPDNQGRMVATDIILQCPPMRRCVNHGVEICVALKTALPLINYPSWGPASSLPYSSTETILPNPSEGVSNQTQAIANSNSFHTISQTNEPLTKPLTAFEYTTVPSDRNPLIRMSISPTQTQTTAPPTRLAALVSTEANQGSSIEYFGIPLEGQTINDSTITSPTTIRLSDESTTTIIPPTAIDVSTSDPFPPFAISPSFSLDSMRTVFESSNRPTEATFSLRVMTEETVNHLDSTVSSLDSGVRNVGQETLLFDTTILPVETTSNVQDATSPQPRVTLFAEEENEIEDVTNIENLLEATESVGVDTTVKATPTDEMKRNRTRSISSSKNDEVIPVMPIEVREMLETSTLGSTDPTLTEFMSYDNGLIQTNETVVLSEVTGRLLATTSVPLMNINESRVLDVLQANLSSEVLASVLPGVEESASNMPTILNIPQASQVAAEPDGPTESIGLTEPNRPTELNSATELNLSEQLNVPTELNEIIESNIPTLPKGVPSAPKAIAQSQLAPTAEMSLPSNDSTVLDGNSTSNLATPIMVSNLPTSSNMISSPTDAVDVVSDYEESSTVMNLDLEPNVSLIENTPAVLDIAKKSNLPISSEMPASPNTTPTILGDAIISNASMPSNTGVELNTSNVLKVLNDSGVVAASISSIMSPTPSEASESPIASGVPTAMNESGTLDLASTSTTILPFNLSTASNGAAASRGVINIITASNAPPAKELNRSLNETEAPDSLQGLLSRPSVNLPIEISKIDSVSSLQHRSQGDPSSDLQNQTESVLNLEKTLGINTMLSDPLSTTELPLLFNTLATAGLLDQNIPTLFSADTKESQSVIKTNSAMENGLPMDTNSSVDSKISTEGPNGFVKPMIHPGLLAPIASRTSGSNKSEITNPLENKSNGLSGNEKGQRVSEGSQSDHKNVAQGIPSVQTKPRIRVNTNRTRYNKPALKKEDLWNIYSILSKFPMKNDTIGNHQFPAILSKISSDSVQSIETNEYKSVEKTRPNKSIESNSSEDSSEMVNSGRGKGKYKISNEREGLQKIETLLSGNRHVRKSDIRGREIVKSGETKSKIKKMFKRLKHKDCNEDEIIGDIHDCKKYYRCTQDSDEIKFKRMRCNKNQRFDSRTKKCVQRRRAKCFSRKDLILQLALRG